MAEKYRKHKKYKRNIINGKYFFVLLLAVVFITGCGSKEKTAPGQEGKMTGSPADSSEGSSAELAGILSEIPSEELSENPSEEAPEGPSEEVSDGSSDKPSEGSSEELSESPSEEALSSGCPDIPSVSEKTAETAGKKVSGKVYDINVPAGSAPRTVRRRPRKKDADGNDAELHVIIVGDSRTVGLYCSQEYGREEFEQHIFYHISENYTADA
ncbi:MAG: hypothetical protein IKN57_00935, partial [Parasporobacterium sp.]|nr:hypothetical protein [Parasporobacterium sp.]